MGLKFFSLNFRVEFRSIFSSPMLTFQSCFNSSIFYEKKINFLCQTNVASNNFSFIFQSIYKENCSLGTNIFKNWFKNFTAEPIFYIKKQATTLIIAKIYIKDAKCNISRNILELIDLL